MAAAATSSATASPMARPARNVRNMCLSCQEQKKGREREHDPEKCGAAFRADHAPMKNYNSGFCLMITWVPTGTRSKRSATSALTRRKQPEEILVPMVQGWLVP